MTAYIHLSPQADEIAFAAKVCLIVGILAWIAIADWKNRRKKSE